ncbi:hypothetical protein OUZ56_005890 [Daphnia magna]|uniref:Secreted protein n=1 Tax=Daphnia magna TaxID=35525 RepID=A0ABQ9YU20_9CRUS|nr:hypothetical protein OUZ56_005890 [Daphnia magna]
MMLAVTSFRVGLTAVHWADFVWNPASTCTSVGSNAAELTQALHSCQISHEMPPVPVYRARELNGRCTNDSMMAQINNVYILVQEYNILR